MVEIKVTEVSPDGVLCVSEGSAKWVHWAELRAAASKNNAEDLRQVYAPALAAARDMAAKAGLVGRRLLVSDGALVGPLDDVSPAQRERLVAMAQAEGWPVGSVEVEELDPDEREESRRGAERQARLTSEIDALL